MKKFTKTIKTAPEGCRTFENGDLCVKLEEYTPKIPNFGYYSKTTTGFKLEKELWKGRQAGQYNWAKQQPGFNPKGKPAKVKAKTVTKPKRKKIAAKQHTESDILKPEALIPAALQQHLLALVDNNPSNLIQLFKK